MDPRLVTCLITSVILGLGAAVASAAFGVGVLVSFLAYTGVSSVALVVLSVAAMPREPRETRPALLPATVRHTA